MRRLGRVEGELACSLRQYFFRTFLEKTSEKIRRKNRASRLLRSHSPLFPAAMQRRDAEHGTPRFRIKFFLKNSRGYPATLCTSILYKSPSSPPQGDISAAGHYSAGSAKC